MDHRISISLGVGLLGLVGWTTLGTVPSLTSTMAPSEDATMSISAPMEDAAAIDAAAIDDDPSTTTNDPVTAPAQTSPAPSTTTTPAPADHSGNSGGSGSNGGANGGGNGGGNSGGNGNGREEFSGRGGGRHGPLAGMLGGGPGGSGPMGGRNQFPPEEIERNKQNALEFWQKYSPERASTINSLHEGQKNRFEEIITQTYLQMQQTRASNPELYEVSLKRMQGEDNIFHLVGELKKNKGDPKLTEQLHDAVESVVKLNLQERQLRLDKLAKTLQQQQDQLKQDQDPANLSKMVDDRFQAELNEHPNFNGGGRPHTGR